MVAPVLTPDAGLMMVPCLAFQLVPLLSMVPEVLLHLLYLHYKNILSAYFNNYDIMYGYSAY